MCGVQREAPVRDRMRGTGEGHCGHSLGIVGGSGREKCLGSVCGRGHVAEVPWQRTRGRGHVAEVTWQRTCNKCDSGHMAGLRH